MPYLDADLIRAATFVRYAEVHELLGSTNDRAAELAREINVELPALIAARRQTAGRGRGQHSWWSADGALTFSLLLAPEAIGIQTASWPRLSLVTAVAVCEALEHESTRLRLGIKWPNDVLIEGRKVGGILIESPGGASPAKGRLIIGIGINVNNSWVGAPKFAGAAGVSLSDATGQSLDLQSLLIRILRAIQQRLMEMGRDDTALVKAWQQRCVLTGQTVVVESSELRGQGTCLGIANNGALLVESATGRFSIYSGTVRSAS